MPDPASLQNLHDIIMPPPVPWWPPAPGWYVVLGLLIGCLLMLAIQAFIRYRRNAYRRSALDELQTADEGPDKIAFISALLKRSALAAYPREQVASLTGKAWTKWLVKASGVEMPASVEDVLQQGVYGGTPVTDTQALADFAAQWIRSHRGVR